MSSLALQLRWPKVFGRAETLDWRGFRGTSRSDRVWAERVFGVTAMTRGRAPLDALGVGPIVVQPMSWRMRSDAVSGLVAPRFRGHRVAMAAW